MATKPAVTLKDVAAVAGVSISIASRVLNGGGRVSPQTRQNIFDAAERLDFRPNALAQFFALGKSYTVGVLAERGSGIFSMAVIAGITSELSKNDIAAIVYDDDNDLYARPENIRKLQARRVDGVIVVGDGNETPYRSIARDFSVPVVYAHCVSDDPTDSFSNPDDRMAGLMAGRHLLEQGKRRLAHISGLEGSHAVQSRLGGLREALGEQGLELGPGMSLHGEWSGRWGYQATAQLLANGADFDGVVCGNDMIALGVLRCLNDHDIAVPTQVAIVGHDNWTKFSKAGSPFLTTIDPRLEDVGRAAVKLLTKAGGEDAQQNTSWLQPCELIYGFSSGAIDSVPEDRIPYL